MSRSPFPVEEESPRTETTPSASYFINDHIKVMKEEQNKSAQ